MSSWVPARLHRMSQQDDGKTLGFSAIWSLPPQKRSTARNTVGKGTLLPGLSEVPFWFHSFPETAKSRDAPKYWPVRELTA
jgi:hypothetical protein